jgi:ABC-2 type transport system ATP-binding protein
VGVAGGSVGDRLGRGQQRQLGEVGAPEDDEPGGAVALDEPGVASSAVVVAAQEPHAGVGGLAGHRRHRVLDEERHAPERAVGKVAGGFGERSLEPRVDHGVQLGVASLDPSDGRLDELWSEHDGDRDPHARSDEALRAYGRAGGARPRRLVRDRVRVPGSEWRGQDHAIRLLVGLLRPTSGSVEVLGDRHGRGPDEVQSRIGYLPGDFKAYPDLTGEQYLRYLGNLRGGVDEETIALLAKRLELDLSRRIGALSHGNRQKVGIVQAFMNDPELLILDEPTTGLDPLMQREFLALVREARDAGRTVLLSSHILTEVEAVADVVGHPPSGPPGRRRRRGAPQGASPPAHRPDLRRSNLPEPALAAIPGVREVDVDGATAQLVVEGSTADLIAALAPYRVDDVVSHEADLEEIFLAHYAVRRTEVFATVFRKTLRDQRRALIGWSAGIVAMLVAHGGAVAVGARHVRPGSAGRLSRGDAAPVRHREPWPRARASSTPSCSASSCRRCSSPTGSVGARG